MCRYGLSDEAIAKVAAAKAGKKDSSGQIVGKIRQTVSSGIQSASTGVKNATETGGKQLLTLHKTQTLNLVHFWFIQFPTCNPLYYLREKFQPLCRMIVLIRYGVSVLPRMKYVLLYH